MLVGLSYSAGLSHSPDELDEIYDSNGGYCYYCGKKLARANYGKYGEKGAWQVDHKNPISTGGSDYSRNLVPACIDCNQDKGETPAPIYKDQFEPTTFGGTIVEALGLPEGFLGASRRKKRK